MHGILLKFSCLFHLCQVSWSLFDLKLYFRDHQFASVLNVALRYLSICVRSCIAPLCSLHRSLGNLLHWPIRLFSKDSKTNIPVVWDVKPCILVCMYLRFGRAFSLQLRPSWNTLKMLVVCCSETLCPIHRSTQRRIPEDWDHRQ